MVFAALVVIVMELGLLPVLAVEPRLVMESIEVAVMVVVVKPGLPTVAIVVAEANEIEATTQQSAAVLAVLVEPGTVMVAIIVESMTTAALLVAVEPGVAMVAIVVESMSSSSISSHGNRSQGSRFIRCCSSTGTRL